MRWLLVDKNFGWGSGPECCAVRQRYEDAEERHRANCVPGVHIQEGASEEVWRDANDCIPNGLVRTCHSVCMIRRHDCECVFCMCLCDYVCLYTCMHECMCHAYTHSVCVCMCACVYVSKNVSISVPVCGSRSCR